MAKTNQQVAARVTPVEKELTQLKAILLKKAAEPWYRQILGDFAGDQAYAKIVRLARLVRSGKLQG